MMLKSEKAETFDPKPKDSHIPPEHTRQEVHKGSKKAFLHRQKTGRSFLLFSIQRKCTSHTTARRQGQEERPEEGFPPRTAPPPGFHI